MQRERAFLAIEEQWMSRGQEVIKRSLRREHSYIWVVALSCVLSAPARTSAADMIGPLSGGFAQGTESRLGHSPELNASSQLHQRRDEWWEACSSIL